MDPTIILAFLMTYKLEVISLILLTFQGWLGKTDKVVAANYLDLIVQVLTLISNQFKKKEEPTIPLK
ncbi:MAG: hypothetical protein PHY48_15135 [Candidatus Cloacimonetes bacterium]|nr:hypothetical protein [Candidatus Cloacimonadota bacterium]